MFWNVKIKKKVSGKNNQILIASKKSYGKIKIKGNNNYIEVPADVVLRDFHFTIIGDNNRIVFGKGCSFHRSEFSIGIVDAPAKDCCLLFGEGVTSSGKVCFLVAEDGSQIVVGDDAMFSSGIDVWCTDTHAITDMSGKITNKGQQVLIGKHVWVGKDVKIGKNTVVPDGCIIGWGSVVASVFDKENVVLAGNPARIVKENVLWKRERPNEE